MIDFSNHTAMISGAVDRRSQDYAELSDSIWEVPEINYEERESARLHAGMLSREGFTVVEEFGGIPTALAGEAGETGPIIAILGEYDALPGLSQQAGVARKAPVSPNGHGHGCGHNMLGAASLLAAAALKECLAKIGVAGRVRYIGCPAEEGGSAKSFLVRSGAFDDVSAALCWHPSAFTGLMEPSSLACMEVLFEFDGVASHAAVAPEEGRSALDAVELMHVGVNYLREHIPPHARLHYAIVNTGGTAPNVVQSYAAARHIIRGANLNDMWALFSRVCKIAEGASLMTGTTVKWQQTSGEANLVGNSVLESLMFEALKDIGPPVFDAVDEAFAIEIARTLPEGAVDRAFAARGLNRSRGAVLATELSARGPKQQGLGSTDVGSVSWVVPTAQCHVACYAAGTPGHSWQLVAQGKSRAAHKGLVQAAKAMALTALRLLADPDILGRAREEHALKVKNEPFRNPVSDVTYPPWAVS
ncbi:amidohydrolase [Roseovarius sp. 217]|uniref:amidohydrolase n=1 Tax=Roseovarius sp. (strain 217) TaxID=314264 RepID=UPI00030C50B8|nr:amidohydrolase [Roseovarius sp. 217]